MGDARVPREPADRRRRRDRRPRASLSDGFDEEPHHSRGGDGIYFPGRPKTASHLFWLDLAQGDRARQHRTRSRWVGRHTVGDAAASPSPPARGPRCPKCSSRNRRRPREKAHGHVRAARDWTLGTREVISWKSQDGATIEGVLIKPADFDPSKKYPLLVRHPRRTDRHRSPDAARRRRYYPVDIWVARGALVLKVNYRGSAGYGEKFRQLNVQQPRRRRRLGRPVRRRRADREGHGSIRASVGCMGWSQGGYISAFLTTSTTEFAAISVGAGISELGDLLLQHRHHAVHDPVSRRRTRRTIRRSTQRPRR